MTLKGELLLKRYPGNYKKEAVSIKSLWWSINLLDWGVRVDSKDFFKELLIII